MSDTWWHIWGTTKRFKWHAEIDTKDGTGEQSFQEAKGSRLLGKPWRDPREGILRSRCEGNSTITVEKGLMLGGAEAGEHRKAFSPKGSLQTWRYLIQEMVCAPCFSLTGIHNWSSQLTVATGKVGGSLPFSLFRFWLGFLLFTGRVSLCSPV